MRPAMGRVGARCDVPLLFYPPAGEFQFPPRRDRIHALFELMFFEEVKRLKLRVVLFIYFSELCVFYVGVEGAYEGVEESWVSVQEA